MRSNTPVDGLDLERARDKLYAVIFPNKPRTQMEADAFEKAVNYQAEYEKAQDEAMDSLPDSVTGFKIGNFSATMEKRTGKEISPEAYGVLLRAGLLYKGLDGRRGGEAPICTRYALGPNLPPVSLTLDDIRQIWGDT